MNIFGNPFVNPFSLKPKSYVPGVDGPHVLPEFNPYDENGGSIIAIATKDSVVIGSDTRLCDKNLIHNCDQPKLFLMSPRTILGSTGCWTDTLALQNLLRIQIRKYEYANHKPMSTEAIAHLLSILIYSRRLVLPYRTFNLIAGLTTDGKGYICSYDGLGHMIKEQYAAVGSALRLIFPVLDSQIDFKTVENTDQMKEGFPLTTERALDLIKDSFVIASDRDVMTGDAAVIKIVRATGIEETRIPLRSD